MNSKTSCTWDRENHTPSKTNGWNLKITMLKRKIAFQTSIFGFHVSQGRSTPCIGDGHPTFNDGNPYNGYIKPYGLGLMSLSPIIWKECELIDPIAHVNFPGSSVKGDNPRDTRFKTYLFRAQNLRGKDDLFIFLKAYWRVREFFPSDKTNIFIQISCKIGHASTLIVDFPLLLWMEKIQIAT